MERERTFGVSNMKITLYELFTLCNITDTDIADNTYDFVVNFSCHLKKGQCHDHYELLMRKFATQIECDRFDVDTPTMAHCDIYGFIKKNIDVFTRFMNEENKEDYQPQNYEEIDDETFYDLYFNTFESLVVGNYGESDYEKLFKALGGN